MGTNQRDIGGQNDTSSLLLNLSQRIDSTLKQKNFYENVTQENASSAYFTIMQFGSDPIKKKLQEAVNVVQEFLTWRTWHYYPGNSGDNGCGTPSSLLIDNSFNIERTPIDFPITVGANGNEADNILFQNLKLLLGQKRVMN